MDLDSFKQAIKHEFGPNLEHATPANVREFVDRFHVQTEPYRQNGRIVLNESKSTYEEILKDFFLHVLEHPRDEALILLWTMAFELSFVQMEGHLSEKLGALFQGMEAE